MRTLKSVAAMLCPICKTGLTMSDRQGVEIDYCSTCRGVWLDRGELDKIIERSINDSAPPQRDAQPQNYGERLRGYSADDDRYRHGKRKKSFLSELFD